MIADDTDYGPVVEVYNRLAGHLHKRHSKSFITRLISGER
jgi:hypothetical protein